MLWFILFPLIHDFLLFPQSAFHLNTASIFIHCAWYHCSISTYHIWTSFSFMCNLLQFISCHMVSFFFHSCDVLIYSSVCIPMIGYIAWFFWVLSTLLLSNCDLVPFSFHSYQTGLFHIIHLRLLMNPYLWTASPSIRFSHIGYVFLITHQILSCSTEFFAYAFLGISS